MRSAAVVGTGAIGTSVALALVRQGVSVHLQDVSSTAVRTAEAMGAGSLELPDGPVDLAVLAVPPAQVAGALALAQRSGLARTYTDVASVKALPHDEVSSAGADPVGYIGGHPLTTPARSGPLAGRADLFEGHPWVLTPSDRTAPMALNRALELVTMCGATPVVMDAADHDRAVALTSHAPHLISALMAARLEHAAESSMRVAGQGLRDLTRVSAGDPVPWRDILHANSDAVADVLADYATDLDATISALRALAGDSDTARKLAMDELDDLLGSGDQGRTRVAPDTAPATVRVTISDRPGALARLFAAVGELGVNIEDIRIEHAPTARQGQVDLLVPRDTTAELSRHLTTGGWTVTP
ncbi:prephenate dehydrogenase [Kitasatospora sp. NPDC006697]|uniref:prephenate dehydrogenase n=1 Tax=Kitasatospora sp. NPDC006697 TaxID=3364020 RepID=UPI0036A0719B